MRAAARVLEAKIDLLGAAAIEQQLPDGLGQFAPRAFQIEVKMACEGLDGLEVLGIASIPAGSKNSSPPRPLQVGQAPAGLLNENMRGSSSGTAKPHSGQAWRLENTCSSSAVSPGKLTRAVPPESRSAVSNDSASRWLASGRSLRRSTTTSKVCLRRASSFGAASISCTAPSMRMRTKPWPASEASNWVCSPLRSTITGASSKACRSGSPAST